MKLYFSPGACSLAAHIGLREAGAAFDLEKVDLKTHKTASGRDFYTISPKGYVPALETERGLLTENFAVLTYVADLKPETGLAPPRGSFERYRLFEWLGFIATEVHKTHKPFFSPDASDQEKSAATQRLNDRYQLVDNMMGTRPYLMGDRFSIADAYLFVMLGWASMAGIDPSKWPAIDGMRGRVAERESVRAAKEAEKRD
jgi:glutathione S-transferase